MKVGDDEYLQGMQDLLHWLNRKWGPDVLIALLPGPTRYFKLLETVRARAAPNRWARKREQGLADSVLGRTLRQMESDELIVRFRDESVFPPAVTYQLTPIARELLDSLEPVINWIAANPEPIQRAQRRRQEDAGLCQSQVCAGSG